MTHPRADIREAAKAALVGKTIAGARVESSRPNPLSQRASALGGKEELPAIIIYTRSTRSEVFNESPRRYLHRVELVVEAALEVTGAMGDIDDELDAYELQVVNALLVDETLNGNAADLVHTGSAMTIADAGAKLLGAVIISLEASYFAHFPTAADAEALDDLVTVHTEHSLSGQQADSADRAITDIEDLDQ